MWKDKGLDRRDGSQQQTEVMALSLRDGLAETPTRQLCSEARRPAGSEASRGALPDAPTLPRCQDPELLASTPQQRTGICTGIWFKISKRTVPATASSAHRDINTSCSAALPGRRLEGGRGIEPQKALPFTWGSPNPPSSCLGTLCK